MFIRLENLRTLAFGSTLVLIGSSGCSEQELKVEPAPNSSVEATSFPWQVDLEPVIEMRMEGKTDDAIARLRVLNESYPASVEVLVQLGRALMDAEQFSLAAFRFEQAISLKPTPQSYLEAAEAHQRSRDFESAIERYYVYLRSHPEDQARHLDLARLLASQNRSTDALNAFSKANELANSEDCLMMANLFQGKNLFSQAKHWFEQSLSRSEKTSTGPLLGLLKIAKIQGNDEEAEKLILELEKTSPGVLEDSELGAYASKVLRSRRLAEFISLGIEVGKTSSSSLAQALLSENAVGKKEQVVAAGPKLPPPSAFANEEIASHDSDSEVSLTQTQGAPKPMSLAEAFAAPIDLVGNASGAIESSLELGRNSFLAGNYTSALLHARDSLKDNPTNAKAWHLCSQAHFQLGENDAAEMTVLEAIRHDPLNLELRMDYLRLARDSLSGQRYLTELEKTREAFPDSVEVLWELARRYHLVEKMPVTAAVLYRKIVQISPNESPLAQQAKLELVKLNDL